MAQMIQNIQMSEEPMVVKNPIFLKFAEYLGYETPLIKWVDLICNGKDIPQFIEKTLDVDAVFVFNKMKEEYTEEEIRMWWDRFYPLVMAEAEFKMSEKGCELPY